MLTIEYLESKNITFFNKSWRKTFYDYKKRFFFPFLRINAIYIFFTKSALTERKAFILVDSIFLQDSIFIRWFFFRLSVLRSAIRGFAQSAEVNCILMRRNWNNERYIEDLGLEKNRWKKAWSRNLPMTYKNRKIMLCLKQEKW